MKQSEGLNSRKLYNVFQSYKTIFLTLGVIASVILGAYLTWFLSINRETINVFNKDKLSMVIEDQVINDFSVKIIKDEIMVPFGLVKKYIDEDISFDEGTSKFIITRKNTVLRLKLDSNLAYENNRSINLQITPQKDGDSLLLPLRFLSTYYELEIKKSDTTNAFIIDKKSNSNTTTGNITMSNSKIRMGPSIRQPIVYSVGQTIPEAVKIFEDFIDSNWSKVRTSQGYVGYIESSSLEIFDINNPKKLEMLDKNIQGKIVMAWEMVYSKKLDFSKDRKISGFDVVSPTWFQISGEKGAFIDRSYKEYVLWAHKNRYKVWALMSNDFNNPTLTGKFLNNSDARQKTIDKLLEKCVVMGIDGINVDFEMVNKKDTPMVLQFIKELTPLFKEKNITVSVDVHVPEGNNLTFDKVGLASLGQAVDYIVMMGYDQFWSGSTVAGSVAELEWTENNLKKLISYNIPREKLILGVPFYTRLWEEKQDKSGKTTVSGKTVLAMEQAKKLAKQIESKSKWDDRCGQFFVEYSKGGSKFKLWLEDENSANMRSSLVLKYEIAGIAAWSKGYEVQEVWSSFEKNLKGTKSYDEWKTANKDLTPKLN